MNKSIDGAKTIAFADDFIAYIPGKSPDKIRIKLQELYNNIDRYYQTWNLRINPDKCETKIFRRMHNYLTKGTEKHYNDFQMKVKKPTTGEETVIPHKNTVKYLGVHLDHLLRLCKHTDTQLNKAKAAVNVNKRIFYSKYLNRRAKIICYQLLIRPILTYAAPIW